MGRFDSPFKSCKQVKMLEQTIAYLFSQEIMSRSGGPTLGPRWADQTPIDDGLNIEYKMRSNVIDDHVAKDSIDLKAAKRVDSAPKQDACIKSEVHGISCKTMTGPRS